MRVAYHAYRDIKAGSRVRFGPSGVFSEGGVLYKYQEFRATRAAPGGMPWRGDEAVLIFKKDAGRALNKESDTQASRDVRAWMSTTARQHGILR